MNQVVEEYLATIKNGGGKVLPSEASREIAKKFGLRDGTDVLVQVMDYFINRKLDNVNGVIVHSYVKASDNRAQYEADLCDRQEVTIDWYLENMFGYPFFRWVPDQIEFGLDPWRPYLDFPVSDTYAKQNNWRIFVQRSNLIAHLNGVNNGTA